MGLNADTPLLQLKFLFLDPIQVPTALLFNL
jgi:hypothetical protein